MNLREIVKQYLMVHQFDGLLNQENECGCDLEDFMRCDELSPFCIPGYKRKPNQDEDGMAEYFIDPDPSLSRLPSKPRTKGKEV